MYKDTRKKIYEELGEEVSGEALHIAFKDKGDKQVRKDKWLKSEFDFKRLISKFGSFYFAGYEELLKHEIPGQYLFRFVYFCTYIRYNDSRAEFGSIKGEGRIVKEKDLQEILGLSQNETIRTKKAWIENGLITIDKNKTIIINPRYAKKGEMTKKELKGTVRMMELGVKEIYENAKPIEHKRLSLFIKILPYVNYNYNIICFNPEEGNKDEIRPMDLKDLCNIAGYDEKNRRKLKNELLKIKVNGSPAIAITEIYNGHAISVNPSIYYRGDNIRAMEWLMVVFNLFDTTK